MSSPLTPSVVLAREFAHIAWARPSALVDTQPGDEPRSSGQEEAAGKLAGIVTVLQEADPDDKAKVFRQLWLKLTYHPGRRIVEAELGVPAYWYSENVRGPRPTNRAL